MTIEKLEEFASNGDKHLTGLDVTTGFPRADKPERPWFNKLFGDITGKINEVVDSIDELPPFEGGVLADTFVTVTTSDEGTVPTNLRDLLSTNSSIKRFGIKGDGTDETEKVRRYHDYCNQRGIASSYAGLARLHLQANARIEIHTDHDFAGCELHLLNSISTNNSFSTTYRVVDPNTPLYTVTGSVATGYLRPWSHQPTTGLYSGTGYVHLISEKPVCGRYFESDTLKFSQPFWMVRGSAVQPLCANLTGYNTGITLKIRDASKSRLTIKNICLIDEGFNRQTILSIERNQVDLKSFTVVQSELSSADTTDYLIKWGSVGNCTASEFNVQSRPYASEGTYVMAMTGAAEMTFRNIYGLNATDGSPAWGVTGNNYISGCYIHNSHLNRFDIHAMGFFIYYYGGSFRSSGCLQVGSGGGVFEVSGTTIYGTSAFRLRGDYGGQLENSTIKVSNITWSPRVQTDPLDVTNTGALVNLSGGVTGIGGKVAVKVPDIIIDGVNDISELLNYAVKGCKLVSIGVSSNAVHVSNLSLLSISNVTLASDKSWNIDINFAPLNNRDITNVSAGVNVYPTIALSNIRGANNAPSAGIPVGIYDSSNYTGEVYSTTYRLYVDKVNCFAYKAEDAGHILTGEISNSNILYMFGGAHKNNYTISGCNFIAGTEYNDLLLLPAPIGAAKNKITNSAFSGTGAYNLQNINSMIGVEVNSSSVLPTTCTAEDAYYGWHKDIANPNKPTV